MATKTPLRELQQAVVCVIAADTYQGYQAERHLTSNRLTLSKPRGAACDRFAHARIMKNHLDCPHICRSKYAY